MPVVVPKKLIFFIFLIFSRGLCLGWREMIEGRGFRERKGGGGGRGSGGKWFGFIIDFILFCFDLG